jgi:tRNA pseudouridine38-40 synthase
MRDATSVLIGEHDFSSFRAAGCQSKTPIKHLYQIDVREQGDFVHFRFRGNAFLHHMVRNLMGCFVAIGRHRHPSSWMADVLAARDRRIAAPTFMPDGLYLADVGYPENFAVPAPQLGSSPWSAVWADSK